SESQLANTYYMKFACYVRMERDEEALEAILDAIEQDPDNADYYEFLASAYSNLNRRGEAVEAMEMAERLRSQQQ
ncbi:hypothetical protein JW921_05310, partial [Candidatus Fermentibacterales bacterium]|nr:hypothetical protein [Candidatus Fermentibacterales bacterium]